MELHLSNVLKTLTEELKNTLLGKSIILIFYYHFHILQIVQTPGSSIDKYNL